jgi:adenylate cyclase
MYAQGSVELLELSHETFNALTEMDSQFGKNMLRALSEKLRQSTHERGLRFARETRLMRAFREHVSPEQLDELLASEQYEDFLKPQHLHATVLFSDIRDFTPRTETLDAMTLANELNDYFSSAVSIIHQHEGIVDKFLGDGVMAVWGIIQPKEDDAEKAVACGLKLIENAPSFSLGGKPVQIGVGIATGQIFYGHVGNQTKQQLTVLGDPVNMASRLEEKTKEVDVPIIVDVHTFEKVEKRFTFTLIGPLELKGKSQPVEGYTIEQLAKKTGKIYASLRGVIS